MSFSKEPLNNSATAGWRVFCPIRAVPKLGNTQSIPAISVLSAEPKSLATSSCRMIQRFPRTHQLELSGGQFRQPVQKLAASLPFANGKRAIESCCPHHNWTPVLIQCVSKRVSSYGAADGTRTRTVSLPGDFKSPVSTDSTTAAYGYNLSPAGKIVNSGTFFQRTSSDTYPQKREGL